MAQRITKRQVEAAAASLHHARINYHTNNLVVVRAEMRYQEIKDAYATQQRKKESK